ncbi:MAG: hypothetical protein PHV60_07170 [bacterium]|nr:hypothetical protein [bacterium]
MKHIKISRNLVLLIIFILLNSVDLFAEERPREIISSTLSLAPKGLYWLDIGLGINGFKNIRGGHDTEGFNSNVTFSYNTVYGLFSIRDYFSREGFTGTNRIRATGLSYGLLFLKNNIYWGVSLGVDDLHGVYKYNKYWDPNDIIAFVHDNEQDFHTTGAVVEIQVFKRIISKNIGTGLKVYYDLNPIMPFYGMLIDFQFGKIASIKSE